MSYSHIVKKTAKVYVWIAVDRNRNEVADIEVSRSREFWSYYEMILKLKKKV